MVVRLNYPNKIKKNNIKETNYGNRGMSLESELNSSNEYSLKYHQLPITMVYIKENILTLKLKKLKVLLHLT